MHMRLFVLLALGLAPLAGFAQLYSWKDASGKIHYGDRPPADREKAARTLRTAPPPEDAGNRRKAFLEKQMAERERRQKAEEANRPTETGAASAPPEAGATGAR